MPKKKPYGERIAAARAKSNWPTQELFGRRIHVTGRTVSNWERGESMPSLFNQGKIAKLLGVNP
jgi:DNA-binding transcriptional regulator YiaG